jgi:hypothetical protein
MSLLSRRRRRRLDRAARQATRRARRLGGEVRRVAQRGLTAAGSGIVQAGTEALDTARTVGSDALSTAITTGSEALGAAITAGSEAAKKSAEALPGRARRLVGNVRTGQFQRTLSALTAVGSVITAAEIYFEHDRASFGNRVMWWPVVLGPVGAVAGAAGAASETMARTTLPIVSALWVANGVQGTYLHLRGVAQKPGGLRHNTLFNIETGPPLLAPLLMTMVGGMGLVASVLRRER